MTAELDFFSLQNLPGWPCAWSPCKRYRYVLWRTWGPGTKPAMFIGLNPSIADETQDDPTIRRCKAFAKSWGCDSLVMTNLFAWRATDPRDMKAADDPVGPDNDAWIDRLAAIAHVKIAAWGVHGAFGGRDRIVAARIPDLMCLGLTKDGAPRHPLYLRSDAELRAWP